MLAEDIKRRIDEDSLCSFTKDEIPDPTIKLFIDKYNDRLENHITPAMYYIYKWSKLPPTELLHDVSIRDDFGNTCAMT